MKGTGHMGRILSVLHLLLMLFVPRMASLHRNNPMLLSYIILALFCEHFTCDFLRYAPPKPIRQSGGHAMNLLHGATDTACATWCSNASMAWQGPMAACNRAAADEGSPRLSVGGIMPAGPAGALSLISFMSPPWNMSAAESC